MTHHRETSARDRRERAVVGVILATLAAGYVALFAGYFPNSHGRMGHDYSYYMPTLLDGYVWFHINGLFSVPWFTPSFCGGSLAFANIQQAYFSVPQFLTFLTGPLMAVRITVFLFAWAGAVSFYVLVRLCFNGSRWSALFGAGFFLFNDFYIHRMIIGHFGYHCFALAPLLAVLVLRPFPQQGRARFWELGLSTGCGGAILAMMAMSDFVSLIIPAALGVILLGLMHSSSYGSRKDFWIVFFASGAVGVGLSIAKMSAVVSFMRQFPRSLYTLPGVGSPFEAVLLVLRSLALSPAWDADRSNLLENAQWTLDRHEWEYSVTIVPFLLLLAYAVHVCRSFFVNREKRQRRWTKLRIAECAGIVLVLIVPVAVTTYSPDWNALLSRLPFLGSSSTLFRWYLLYIPATILVASLALERVPWLRCRQPVVVIAGLAVLVGIQAFTNREYYRDGEYDPSNIEACYHQTRQGVFTPAIAYVDFGRDEEKKPIQAFGGNDFLVRNTSQLLCYECIFGYRLEMLPFKSLHPGPVFDTTGGVFNIKNPASYLWPRENNCNPGDHFRLDQETEARNFVNYRPFHFIMPWYQRAANWTSLLFVCATGVFFLGYGIERGRRGMRK